MNEVPLNSIPKPFLLRFMLWLGRPFGLDYIDEQHVRVIYRMGRYWGVRGPGLFYYDRFMFETPGPAVHVGPQTRTYTFSELITRDNLVVTAQVQVIIRYDPRDGAEYAPNLAPLDAKKRDSVVQAHLQGACLATFNLNTLDQIVQQSQRPRLERHLTDRLNDSLRGLGFRIPDKQLVRLLTITRPASVTQRHEINAERRLTITAANAMLPEDLRRALLMEVLENLGKQGGTNAHISFNEALDQYLLEHPTVIEHRPAPPTAEPPPSAEASEPPPDETQPRPRSRL